MSKQIDNFWFSDRRFSSANPPPAPAGSPGLLPPPLPPDPPDLPRLEEFPPLTPPSSALSPSSSPSPSSNPPLADESVVLALKAPFSTPSVPLSQPIADFAVSLNFSFTQSKRKTLATVTHAKKLSSSHLTGSTESSPLATQTAPLASSPTLKSPEKTTTPGILGTSPSPPPLTLSNAFFQLPKPFPSSFSPPSAHTLPHSSAPLSSPVDAPSTNKNTSSTPTKTWAERIKKATDKTLKRVSPVTLSPEGVPRVIIPNSIFHDSASKHKDFIVGKFLCKPPPPLVKLEVF